MTMPPQTAPYPPPPYGTPQPQAHPYWPAGPAYHQAHAPQGQAHVPPQPGLPRAAYSRSRGPATALAIPALVAGILSVFVCALAVFGPGLLIGVLAVGLAAAAIALRVRGDDWSLALASAGAAFGASAAIMDLLLTFL